MIARLLVALVLAALAPGAFATACTGHFLNPVTDICWRCMLPLSIGSARIANLGGQRDIENPSSPVCSCPGVPPKVGLSIGFWEPAILSEVVRKPYCFPSLGGIELPEAIPAPRHGRKGRSATGEAPEVFYQAHHYVYPILYLLGALADHPCLQQVPWDLAYLTEVDPTWNSTELSAIFNAESLLFANPVAIAACAADCVAATADFGFQTLFWCAGCQGGIYPTQGRIPHHTGMVDSSLLIAQRLTYKLHKQAIAWQYHGAEALCGPTIAPVMDKRAYKTQMVAPTPATASVEGGCCQPFGANSVTWRAGKEYPFAGEDAAYLLFRKRNCCLSPY